MKNSLCILAVLTSICFVSCNKPGNTTPNTNNSDIMFLNFTETGVKVEPLDGKVNDSIITCSDSLKIQSYPGYISVPSGTKDISFWITGGNRLVDTSQLLVFKEHYSAFAVGPFTAPYIVFSNDDLMIPMAGNAKVRFANFCSGIYRSYFKFGNATIDTMQYYLDPITRHPYVSDFTEIPAGTKLLTATNIDNPSQNTGIISQTFEAAGIYTVVFCDSSTNGNSGFFLTVIRNQ